MTGHRPSLGRSVAAVSLTLAVLGSGAAVLAHAPNPTLSGSPWPDNAALTFRWRSGAEPASAIKTAIRDAADDNNATKASRAARFVYSSSGSGLIGYGPGATCGVNGIGCFTRSAPDGSFTMWLREHGRVFDWGVLRWCQMYSSPPNGCYDAETIALDEFGHIQVLNHHDNYDDDRDYTDAVVQTLSRTKPRTGWDMHVYGRCDVAALQLEYDTPNSSGKYSTCLEVDTVLTLSASPTSIAYGGTTRLTALLKVASVSGYGRLKGNPVSDRTVKLQRRAPGTSTWTTVATMPPTTTAGTYSITQKLQTDAEFRATFASPSDEGLDGDNSSVVSVAVGACTGSCPLLAPLTGTEVTDGP